MRLTGTILCTVVLALCTTVRAQSDVCATPSNFLPGATLEGGQLCSNFASLLTGRTAADCNTNVLGDSTLHQGLWFVAAHCCSDGVPNAICGGYQTVCQDPADFNPTTVFPDGGPTCGAASVSTIVPLLTGSSCDLVVNGGGSGGGGTSLEQSLLHVAGTCCTGGVPDVNTICGPAPADGSMCANPAHFDPSADSGFGNCAGLQNGFFSANLYGDPTQCSTVTPNTNNLPLGAIFAAGAPRCCQGNPISSTCSADRVSPCADSADFTPDAPINFGSDSNDTCSLATLFLYGATPSTCDQAPAFAGPDSPSISSFLQIASRDCCGSGEPNFLCGTPSPTPQPPPRTGETTACPGSFEVYRLDQPGGAQCTGTPSETGSVAEVCGAFTGSDGDTMHLFLISNGGACVNFASQAECLAAAADVEDIVAGGDVSALAPNSPDVQCFLAPGTCAAYPVPFGVALELTPACPCDGGSGKGKKKKKGGCSSGGKKKASSMGMSSGNMGKAKTMGKGQKVSSVAVLGGSAGATSGILVAVVLVAAVAVAAVLLVLQRRSASRLGLVDQSVEGGDASITVSNPVYDETSPADQP